MLSVLLNMLFVTPE